MEGNALKEHLKELEESHLKPDVRTSPQQLDKILADDFFEFGSSGYIIVKQDCIGEGGVEPFEMSLHHFDIHPLAPDVVLTTYYIKDQTRNRNTLRSSIWKWIDGRWQMFFHQGTITNLEFSEISGR